MKSVLWRIERIPARGSGGVTERNGRGEKEDRLSLDVFVKIK
jgi:hypothetical protein